MKRSSKSSTRGLDKRAFRLTIKSVRCGSLQPLYGKVNPESLAGLKWKGTVQRCRTVSAKGPAPLSTWGFSLVGRFCGDVAELGYAAEVKPIRMAHRGKNFVARAQGRNWRVRLARRIAHMQVRVLPSPQSRFLTALRASAVGLHRPLGMKDRPPYQRCAPCELSSEVSRKTGWIRVMTDSP